MSRILYALIVLAGLIVLVGIANAHALAAAVVAMVQALAKILAGAA